MDGRSKEAVVAQVAGQYMQSPRRVLQEIGQGRISLSGGDVEEALLKRAAEEGRTGLAALVARRSRKLPVEAKAAGLAGAIQAQAREKLKSTQWLDEDGEVSPEVVAGIIETGYSAVKLTKAAGGIKVVNSMTGSKPDETVEQLAEKLGVIGDYSVYDPNLVDGLEAVAKRLEENGPNDEIKSSGRALRVACTQRGLNLGNADGYERRYFDAYTNQANGEPANKVDLDRAVESQVEAVKRTRQARSQGRELLRAVLGLQGKTNIAQSQPEEDSPDVRRTTLYDHRGMPRLPEIADMELDYPTELQDIGMPRRLGRVTEWAAKVQAYASIGNRLAAMDTPRGGLVPLNSSEATAFDRMDYRLHESEKILTEMDRDNAQRRLAEDIEFLENGLKQAGGNPNQVRLPVAEG